MNRKASVDVVAPDLKPYWGKPDVRNFREGTGNVDDGGTRNPLRNRKGAGRKLST